MMKPLCLPRTTAVHLFSQTPWLLSPDRSSRKLVLNLLNKHQPKQDKSSNLFYVFLVLFLSTPRCLWLDWLGTAGWLLGDQGIAPPFPPAQVAELPHLLPGRNLYSVIGFLPKSILKVLSFLLTIGAELSISLHN